MPTNGWNDFWGTLFMIDLFRALSRILTRNKARLLAEHMEFLETYKNIVNAVSVETAAEFNRVSVVVIKDNQEKNWAIELTPIDQMWWAHEIKEGARFRDAPSKVLRDMLEHLTSKVEVLQLNAEEHQLLRDVMNK